MSTYFVNLVLKRNREGWCS